MKEITVLSGKGGTGKTSITAALASVAKNAIFCDSDVDAADLHLILNPQILEKNIFEGAWMASIDENKCSNCGLCKDHCRFDAIHINPYSQHYINAFQCEGCRLCERICPDQAISSKRSENNFWYVSNTRFGKMVHAEMGPGEENSGKLVSQVRSIAREMAKELQLNYILTDGPPGIGCPVISTLSRTQEVLLIIEPSQSGLHDIKRLIQLVNGFKIPMKAVINKYDINLELSEEIEVFLNSKEIPLLSKISFDENFVEAMIHKQSIIEYAPHSQPSKQIIEIWNALSL